MAEEFPVVPEKTAMLFFDTLNGGLHPQDPARAAAIESSGYIERLIKIEQACRKAGIPIFYTLPEHRQDGKDWGLAVVGNPPRLTYFAGTNYKGSAHAVIIPEIEPQPGDYIITKHRWSSFHQTCLELSLRTANIDTIILAGGSTNVGIASTAYSARDYDYSQIILSDGCRSGDPSINDYFMEHIFPKFARVMTVDEAVEDCRIHRCGRLNSSWQEERNEDQLLGADTEREAEPETAAAGHRAGKRRLDDSGPYRLRRQ